MSSIRSDPSADSKKKSVDDEAQSSGERCTLEFAEKLICDNEGESQ